MPVIALGGGCSTLRLLFPAPMCCAVLFCRDNGVWCVQVRRSLMLQEPASKRLFLDHCAVCEG